VSPAIVDNDVSAADEHRAKTGSAAPDFELATSEYARRLDAAYTEYLASVAAGEGLDEEAFCRRHSAVRSSLAKLISAHRFLENNSRLLGDSIAQDRQQAQAPPDWPAVGELFEGFQLLRELGRGTFSRVYLGRQPALGDRLVAVKVTPHANYEAAALGRVEHPNIVPVHSVHQAPGRRLSIVCMPYRGRVTLHEIMDALPADGALPRAGTLLDACRDETLPAGRISRRQRKATYCDAVRSVAAQLADALAYLHERGTSHRDLKPSNVLLQPDGTPLLLDFNLSDNPQTPNLCVGGTLAYMAPEQLRAMKDKQPGAHDGKLDVFALGVILYEWLAGKLPFGPVRASIADEALLNLIDRQRAGQMPLARQRHGIDASLARLIERCLAFDPAQRPTARQLAKMLHGQLQPHRRLARAVARRPRRAAAALVLSLALVSGAVAYGVTRPSADERAYQDGVTAYLEGRYEKAEEHLNRAVVMKPNEVRYRYARARTWQQLGDVKREYAGMAAAEYDAAEAIQSDSRHAAGSGYSLQRLQYPQVARLHYEKAMARGFKSPALLNNLACCWLGQSDSARATEHLERALELDGDLVQAHWNMAITQKHVWAPLVIKSAGERAADARFRPAVERAKHHIARAIALCGSPPAEMYADAAHIHAMAVILDPREADAALRMAEHAVDAGTPPATLLKDQFLKQALQARNDFAALLQRQPGAPAARLSRLVDPLSGL
jgi:eukaryotic-like serine/threonine-protein kinase